MARQLQLRRGTATQHNTFTGAQGEVTVDTTGNNLRLHDGVTAGGNPTAMTNQAQAFTKPQYITPYSLTSGVAVDAATYQSWVATVNGGTFTVTNPTGGISGCYYALYITYSSTNTIAFGANFKGITNYVPTATAGTEDHLVFRFDGTYYECVGYATNIKA